MIEKFEVFRASDIERRMQERAAFQKTLEPWDERHERMFRFTKDGQYVLLYWGGYEYPMPLDHLRKPGDLLWSLHHLGEKDWKHLTGGRVRELIEAVAHRKGWALYQ